VTTTSLLSFLDPDRLRCRPEGGGACCCGWAGGVVIGGAGGAGASLG
jgi:hypothetical protein